MAQKCKICELGKQTAHEVEKDFLDGMSTTNISKKYKVGYYSVRYHCEEHISDKLVQVAKERDDANSMDLMGRVDELFTRIEKIYKRNERKGKDHLALKALSEHRYLIELLAKVSYALHQTKQQEIEAKKDEILNIDLPMYKLTKKEQDLYFQLQMKLLGEKEDEVSLSGYMNVEEVEYSKEGDVEGENEVVGGDRSNHQDQNILKTPKRIRRKHPNEDLKFKPINKAEPTKEHDRARRQFARTIKKIAAKESQAVPLMLIP